MPLNGMPGHGQCCATCGTGVHSRRCDRAFRRFQRLIVSVCRTAGCNLQVQEGHTTCCSTCWLSGGRQHTRRCSRRQGLLTARLHAWAPAGADGAGADGTAAAPNIAAHRGSVEGGSNRDALATSRAAQGQAMGGANASNLGDQPGTWLIEVLSSSEEDGEQFNDQANMQQTATHEPLQFQSAATCVVLVEDGLDGLDGLDLMSMD